MYLLWARQIMQDCSILLPHSSSSSSSLPEQWQKRSFCSKTFNTFSTGSHTAQLSDLEHPSSAQGQKLISLIKEDEKPAQWPTLLEKLHQQQRLQRQLRSGQQQHAQHEQTVLRFFSHTQNQTVPVPPLCWWSLSLSWWASRYLGNNFTTYFGNPQPCTIGYVG